MSINIWVTCGFLLLLMAISEADICTPDMAYTFTPEGSAENKVIGRLKPCPRENEVISDELRFRLVTPHKGMSLEEDTGYFEFTIPDYFSGTVQMSYIITDANGFSSDPAQITINVPRISRNPVLHAADVTGMEGEDIPLNMQVFLDETDESVEVSLVLCSCEEGIRCNRLTGRCNCRIRLPEDWQFYDSENNLLTHQTLDSLQAHQITGLTLRPLSSGEECLDVHIIWLSRSDNNPMDTQLSNIKHQLRINVKPRDRNMIVSFNGQNGPNEGTVFHTKEGQPIQFLHLTFQDNGIEGTYRVSVEVNGGGVLCVRQDLREDVVFYPLESSYDVVAVFEFKEINSIGDFRFSSNAHSYHRLHRDGNGFRTVIRDTNENLPDEELWIRIQQSKTKTDQRPRLRDANADFYEFYRPYNASRSSNCKSRLEFVGSQEGINDVLATLLYIPWCKEWPVPPNWNLPENTWMIPQPVVWDLVEGRNVDPTKPNVWPPWYPRFWRPYPNKHWTNWPRVLPPSWLNQVCQDWASTIRIEVEKVSQQTCDADTKESITSLEAEIHVDAQTSQPKLLITRNVFNYFDSGTRSFWLTNLELSSQEQEVNLGFRVHVNNTIAEAMVLPSRESFFNCYDICECNSFLRQIRLVFNDNGTGICTLPIQIQLYEEESDRLVDDIVIWGVNTTDECVNMLSQHPSFTMVPAQSVLKVHQGKSVPLNIAPNIFSPNMKGILNAIVYAKDGLVTLRASSLRVYLDHMGQHMNMMTFFCISGPAYDVIKALMTAEFIPKKNFKGVTEVFIEYGMPSTSLRRVYGFPLGSQIPKRLVTINIYVTSGSLPSSPILIKPLMICSKQDDGIIPIDMVKIGRRYTTDHEVSLSMYSQKGSFTLKDNISSRYECGPVKDIMSQPQQCSLHDSCFGDHNCTGNQRCCPDGTRCGQHCKDPIEVVEINLTSTKNMTLRGQTRHINRVLEEQGVIYLARSCKTNEFTAKRQYDDAILFTLSPSSRYSDGHKPVVEYMAINIPCRIQNPIPVPQDHGDHPL